jgi:hypothetical protein
MRLGPRATRPEQFAAGAIRRRSHSRPGATRAPEPLAPRSHSRPGATRAPEPPAPRGHSRPEPLAPRGHSRPEPLVPGAGGRPLPQRSPAVVVGSAGPTATLAPCSRNSDNYGPTLSFPLRAERQQGANVVAAGPGEPRGQANRGARRTTGPGETAARARRRHRACSAVPAVDQDRRPPRHRGHRGTEAPRPLRSPRSPRERRHRSLAEVAARGGGPTSRGWPRSGRPGGLAGRRG